MVPLRTDLHALESLVFLICHGLMCDFNEKFKALVIIIAKMYKKDLIL